MQLAFIDIVYGYNADRPESHEPLGGTTSAICFLAQELVKKGIGCTIFNKISAPETCHNIPCLPLSQLADPSIYKNFSAFIFCGRWIEELVNLVKSQTTAPLIAWMHESQFNPPLTPALQAFDATVFVSEWQKDVNQQHVQKHWQQTIIRNAMNPRAAQLFSSSGPILLHKKQPSALLYAGSFARGAFHIAPILERLRPLDSNFTIDIFCNTTPSGHPESDQAYILWLRHQQNVTHVGMVGQPELIQAMQQASVMVAPNPWPETSCIAMIEAMASGLKVITTNRAALPETAAGYASLVEIEGAHDATRFDSPIDYDVFAQNIAKALRDMREHPEQEEQERRIQIDYFLNHYQWHQRIEPWVAFINKLCSIKD